MCNLYSVRKTREELVGLFDVRAGGNGSFDHSASIYPDSIAPAIRLDSEGNRELLSMRWGFPPPPKVGTRPVTNVRNIKSSFWRH